MADLPAISGGNIDFTQSKYYTIDKRNHFFFFYTHRFTGSVRRLNASSNPTVCLNATYVRLRPIIGTHYIPTPTRCVCVQLWFVKPSLFTKHLMTNRTARTVKLFRYFTLFSNRNKKPTFTRRSTRASSITNSMGKIIFLSKYWWSIVIRFVFLSWTTLL